MDDGKLPVVTGWQVFVLLFMEGQHDRVGVFWISYLKWCSESLISSVSLSIRLNFKIYIGIKFKFYNKLDKVHAKPT